MTIGVLNHYKYKNRAAMRVLAEKSLRGDSACRKKRQKNKNFD
jgi:hypothetical protein